MFRRLFGKKSFKYRCHECGAYHEGEPSFSFKYPTYFFDVPEAERPDRVQMSDDPFAHLECDVLWGAKGKRPKVELWENAHPLALDQHNGISWKRAIEIANQTRCGFPGSKERN